MNNDNICDTSQFPKYFTPKQVAELLQISEQSVTRYIRLGKIKALQVGANYRISEEAVMAIFEHGISRTPLTKKPKRRKKSGTTRSGGSKA